MVLSIKTKSSVCTDHKYTTVLEQTWLNLALLGPLLAIPLAMDVHLVCNKLLKEGLINLDNKRNIMDQSGNPKRKASDLISMILN